MAVGYETRRWLVRRAAKVAPRYGPRLYRSRLNPNRHRWVTGGAWDEMGDLQLRFLVDQGLRPDHHLLDVGCGALRGGVHFVRYLEPGHYCGIERMPALLKAGRRELDRAGLSGKAPVLVQDDAFRFQRFHRRFDYALAHSVFTHLPFNVIMRCLSEMEGALGAGGRFYATYFPNTGRRLRHDDVTGTNHVLHCDRDPYYYDPGIFEWAVEGSALSCTVLGDWGHPRDQHMLLFTKEP